MPNIRIELLAGRTREQKEEISKVFTRDLARIAQCNEASIQVIFSEVNSEDWAVGGVLGESKKQVIDKAVAFVGAADSAFGALNAAGTSDDAQGSTQRARE